MKDGKGIRAALDGFFLAVMSANSPLVLMLLEKREQPVMMSDGKGCHLRLNGHLRSSGKFRCCTDLLYVSQGNICLRDQITNTNIS